MRNKKWFKILPLILLTSAIALSPSFSAGKIAGGRVIEIRIEDILIVILGLAWIANFLILGRKKIQRPPLFFPILAWLGIGFFSLMTNWIFMNIGFSRGFFYFLKEIEFFFLYFYLFYHIKNLDAAKFIVKFWVFLGVVNVGWIIYQFVTGLQFGTYGPSAIVEQGSYPSGGFFLILFIFLFNISLYYFLSLNISNFKKGILMIAAISPALGVFASASRTAFLGFIFSLFLTISLLFLRKKSFKIFLVSILLLFVIGAFFALASKNVSSAKRLVKTMDLSYNIGEKRAKEIWKFRIEETMKNPWAFLFGFGKSVVLGSEESHSQYIRNFSEVGIIGSLVFLFLILIIIKKALKGFLFSKAHFLIGLSSGLLIATLTMLLISIPGEAFIVVKIAEVYWFFAALTLTSLKLYEKQQSV